MKTVWVFVSDRILDNETVHRLRHHVRTFLDEWKDHGKPIRTTLDVVNNTYFIVTAHEERVDGCPTDDLYKFFRQLGQRHGIDFMNRFRVGYIDEARRFHLTTLDALPRLYAEGKIHDDTLFYNHVVNTPEELKEWLQPLRKLWVARFVKRALQEG